MVGLKEDKSISNIVIDDLQYEHTSEEVLEVPEYVLQGVSPVRVSSRKTAGIGPCFLRPSLTVRSILPSGIL